MEFKRERFCNALCEKERGDELNIEREVKRKLEIKREKEGEI